MNKEVIISRIAGSLVAEERLSAASEAFAPLTWKGIGSCRWWPWWWWWWCCWWWWWWWCCWWWWWCCCWFGSWLVNQYLLYWPGKIQTLAGFWWWWWCWCWFWWWFRRWWKKMQFLTQSSARFINKEKLSVVCTVVALKQP